MGNRMDRARAAAAAALAEMSAAGRGVPAKAALAASAALACPALAWADDYKTTINEVAQSGSDLMNAIGFGLLLLVAGLALVAIAKEILPAIFARENVEFKAHTKVLIVVVIMCIIAGFLPMIINSITDIAGQGVDLGTAEQS